jgi:hypothetical protein
VVFWHNCTTHDQSIVGACKDSHLVHQSRHALRQANFEYQNNQIGLPIVILYSLSLRFDIQEKFCETRPASTNAHPSVHMTKHTPTVAFQQTPCIIVQGTYACRSAQICELIGQPKDPYRLSDLDRLVLSSRDIHYTLFSLSLEDSGGARDFSHSSKKLLAVRLILLGDRRLTTLGRISSSLGERIGAALMAALPFLFQSVSA